MIKYTTKAWGGGRIEVVEIEKETEHCVWEMTESYGGKKLRRYKKHSDYSNYFDTWQEAFDYLLVRAMRKLKLAQEQVIHAEIGVEKVKKLREE